MSRRALVELGRCTFPIGAAQVSHPAHNEVVSVSPDLVRISLRPSS
ncbi:MAG: hypothetical protein JRF61_28320 [Deltaproteobacteria bacterium]|nr:hypothetical protein [Deltaproteobacteria bacterium]